MPDHKQIYQQQARQYEHLIQREDYQKTILPVLQKITPLCGKDILDTGSGTGRLAYLLAPFAKSIIACDASEHMLDFATRKLEISGFNHWHTQVADHHHLPTPDNSIDIVTSGWSVCYLVESEHPHALEPVEIAIKEMKRVLRPGGTIIILETLGIGVETPDPPEKLKPYYHRLEQLGFKNQSIRTDYQFESLEEMQELVTFFFGAEMADNWQANPEIRLPECTGIWHFQKPQ